MKDTSIHAGEDLKPGDPVHLKEVDGKLTAFKTRPKPQPAPHQEYEVINPSDECYITGGGEELAAACVFLGRGKYALRAEDGTEGCPLFLFGGFNEWWTETFGRTFDAYMETKPHEAIAKVLETFRYQGERSSMNNIGKAAQRTADALRIKAKEA